MFAYQGYACFIYMSQGVFPYSYIDLGLAPAL